MCMGLNSLTLDLPVMTRLDLSMLGIKNLTLNCNKLVYANLRGSYKLESSVRASPHVLSSLMAYLVVPASTAIFGGQVGALQLSLAGLCSEACSALRLRLAR